MPTLPLTVSSAAAAVLGDARYNYLQRSGKLMPEAKDVDESHRGTENRKPKLENAIFARAPRSRRLPVRAGFRFLALPANHHNERT